MEPPEWPGESIRSRGRWLRGQVDRLPGVHLDGDVVTACQAVCPTGAIAFGDLNDTASAVRSLRHSPRHYALLGELNTRPRTTYLARIRNPNPELG